LPATTHLGSYELQVTTELRAAYTRRFPDLGPADDLSGTKWQIAWPVPRVITLAPKGELTWLGRLAWSTSAQRFEELPAAEIGFWKVSRSSNTLVLILGYVEGEPVHPMYSVTAAANSVTLRVEIEGISHTYKRRMRKG